MRMSLGVVALLMAVAFAGCADVEPTAMAEGISEDVAAASGMIPVAPDPAEFLGRIIDSHAVEAADYPQGLPFIGSAFGFLHEVPDLHADSFNLALADHNDLSEGLIGPSSGYIETDVVGDIALVASIMGSRGATLVDVSDPTDLKVLSHIYNFDDNWDARISEDGQYVFLGCQGSTAFDCTGFENGGEGPQVTGGAVCTSIADNAGTGCQGGIAVYDISDPTTPTYIEWLPMGFTHNVFTFMMDGNHYFMSAAGKIGEWNPEAGTVKMAAIAPFGSHDMAVQQHPLTGDWLMYAGTGGPDVPTLGMGIWNVNDPFNPVAIGGIDPERHANMSVPATWHEQTPMPCLIDGRHYTIGAGENGGGGAERIAIIDTTDPLNATWVGEWQLPDHAALSSQGMYRYSVHNIDANCDGQIAMGHYHAGVWVFDISTPERVKEPATLGFYLPSERSLAPQNLPVAGAPIGGVVTGDIPNVWSATWSEDGKTLFIPDMITGFYALTPQWDFEA
jgi:hypothetical protein